MLIRCKHKRDGGTTVPFSFPDAEDYREYAFLPNAKGDHVADVDDEADATTLLSIESAYEAYDPDAPKGRKASVKPVVEHGPSPTAFLDELERADLVEYATGKGVKLDEQHSDEQVRHYLKGLIAKKG